ncbi:MAG: hypothetical protein J0M03_23255 [Acidobacteria bacterium]|nr:hypothetical protein [Acidobacteriota bacterium]
MSANSQKKTLKEELAGMSLEEKIEFFDTHDTGEYEDEMLEVEFQMVHSSKSRKYRDQKKLQDIKNNLDKAS